VLLVFIAFLRPGKLDSLSKFMSPLLFGIYLAHHFIGHRLLVKIPGVEHSQLFFIVDFAVTAVAVYLLKKTPLRRFV
jgi:surface polysaccharide O-acyltransferase-like enzyme